MLYRDFLYQEFLQEFSIVFRFPKPSKKLQLFKQHYNWDDQIYRDFMISMFMKLEPRFENKGNVIFGELDEINEIIFHQKGKIDIGFEITRKHYMVLRIEKGSIVGAYNCITNKPNQFVYKAISQVEGYMLRKQAWVELSEEFDEIADILKQNVK